jgi:hypothetical protein
MSAHTAAQTVVLPMRRGAASIVLIRAFIRRVSSSISPRRPMIRSRGTGPPSGNRRPIGSCGSAIRHQYY